MPTPPITPPPSPLVLQTPSRILVRKWVRNGLVPNAVFESELAAALNFVAGVRNKQLFSGGCGLASIPAGQAATRTRWRFAAHTSPLLRRIKCTVLVARSLVAVGGGTGSNPTVTLTLTNADGSVTYGSGSFVGGASGASPNDTPNEWLDGEITISGVPADTTVFGRFDDVDGGRLISACVYEESLKPTAANGYIVPSQCAATMPIYDARRKAIYELATRLWKRQGAHLINWTANDQATPASTTSTSQANIMGVSDPGYTIDLRYCRTRSKTTVPCVLAVYGWMESTAGGNLQLREGANVLASITGWTSTPTWQTVAVDLDASLTTYTLYFANGGIGRTFNVGAVSLFQYAA